MRAAGPDVAGWVSARLGAWVGVSTPPAAPGLRADWEAMGLAEQRRLRALAELDEDVPAEDLDMVRALAAAGYRRRWLALAVQVTVAWLWLMLLWGVGRSLGGAAEDWLFVAGLAAAAVHLAVAVPSWVRRTRLLARRRDG